MKRFGGSLRAVDLSSFLQGGFNTSLIRWVPRLGSRVYLHLMGRLYYFLRRKEKAEIQENLFTVLRRVEFGKPADLVASRTFRGILAHYHEKLFVAYARFDRVCRFLDSRVEVDHQHLLDEALALGRGLILVTAHFGAVEFLPLTLALKGYAVTMVVRFKTERLKRALQERADQVGVKLLDADDGPGVAFAALRALKANRILITECDEFSVWRPLPRQAVKFLGHPCPVDRTLDLLHRRYRSPVVMGLTCRDGRSGYRLRLHGLVDGDGSVAKGIAQEALALLEQYICEMPDQWYQWKKVRMIFAPGMFEERAPLFVRERTPGALAPDSSL